MTAQTMAEQSRKSQTQANFSQANASHNRPRYTKRLTNMQGSQSSLNQECPKCIPFSDNQEPGWSHLKAAHLLFLIIPHARVLLEIRKGLKATQDHAMDALHTFFLRAARNQDCTVWMVMGLLSLSQSSDLVTV